LTLNQWGLGCFRIGDLIVCGGWVGCLIVGLVIFSLLRPVVLAAGAGSAVLFD
jgi:hypothetical protein